MKTDSDPRQFRLDCPMCCSGCDHFNLELNFLFAFIDLSKKKTGFLEIPSVQSSSAKAAYISATVASLPLSEE